MIGLMKCLQVFHVLRPYSEDNALVDLIDYLIVQRLIDFFQIEERFRLDSLIPFFQTIGLE